MVKGSDILFCGLVREPGLLRKSINELEPLKKKKLVSQIILSTVENEIDKYPGLRTFLEKKNILLIEDKNLKDRGRGNIWSQMRSLDIALQKSKSPFIFKTRPDVHINLDFLKKLFSENENLLKITHHLPKGDVFKYKIWVPSFELKIPYYVADICFYGHREDIQKMVNFDRSYDPQSVFEKEVDKAVHIRRFVHPFLERYPDLYDQFKKKLEKPHLKTLALQFSKKYLYLGGIRFLQELRWEMDFRNFRKRLENNEYVASLAKYYYIMLSHFYVDSDSFPDQVSLRQEYDGGKEIDNVDLLRNFSRRMLQGKHIRHLHVYNEILLTNIFEKKIKKDWFTTKLLKAMDAFLQK